MKGNIETSNMLILKALMSSSVTISGASPDSEKGSVIGVSRG